MALFDVIEFVDDSSDIVVCRFPEQGSGEYALGSQLIVQESQVAIFFRDGQALDGFRAGRHTLCTQNLPLLGRLIGAAFGGRSPFRSCVYFISTRTFTNLGWGTASPVLFRDAELRMMSLRAHGTFSFRVVRGRLFLNSIVGTRGLETTHSIESFFRTMIVSKLNEVLGTRVRSVLDLASQYADVALEVKRGVGVEFEQYGLQLVDLVVEAITPTRAVQRMIDRAGGVAAQDAEKYRLIAAADAMRDAARTPGGASNAPMGAGLGLAMGMGLGREFYQPVSPIPAGLPPAAAPATPLTVAAVQSGLQELKQLVADGLITPADFEEQKRRLLSQL
jgi:membrane protease subunit (stomatin/prohibitin family)